MSNNKTESLKRRMVEVEATVYGHRGSREGGVRGFFVSAINYGLQSCNCRLYVGLEAS